MLWAQNTALCNRIQKIKKIRTEFRFVDLKPKVNYSRVSHAQLVKATEKETVLGVTIAPLTSDISFEIVSHIEENTLCVFIKTVKYTFGYPKQDVWIDNRYATGSCEYDTIVKHENQHVRYNNMAMKRYKRRFKLAVKQEYRNVSPLQIRNDAYASQRVQYWLKKINDIPYLTALENEMNQLLALKHGHIDTDHNYKRTERLCDNW